MGTLKISLLKHEQRIRDIKEISLAIDTWDDIYSDFDPRPLNERALSEDFIAELKKRYRETRRGAYLLTMYAPVALRDEKTEKVIIQRLKTHFKHRALQSKREINRIRTRGFIFVSIGIFFLTFLTFATYFMFFTEFMIELLGIILMPLGWFGIWEGFSKIVDISRGSLQEEILFDKLSKANYRFRYIEPDGRVQEEEEERLRREKQEKERQKEREKREKEEKEKKEKEEKEKK